MDLWRDNQFWYLNMIDICELLNASMWIMDSSQVNKACFFSCLTLMVTHEASAYVHKKTDIQSTAGKLSPDLGGLGLSVSYTMWYSFDGV